MGKALHLFFRSCLLMLVFTVLFGGAYPFLIYGIGQLFFTSKSQGSLLYDVKGSKLIGSSLIGQNFQEAKYFHGRPSFAGKEGYDAMDSSGSNLAPTSKTLLDAVQQRAKNYRVLNALPSDMKIPVDALTSSASGLDPHISFANAYLQVARVAKARGLPESFVLAVLYKHVNHRTLGIFGERRVNVLLLNLALDRQTPLTP